MSAGTALLTYCRYHVFAGLVTGFIIYEGVTSFAQQVSPAIDSKVALVVSYLNSVTTVEATFIQEDAKKGVRRGHVWIDLSERIGKIRSEYDPPYPDLIIANPFDMYFYDGEPHKVETRITPWRFILKKPILNSDLVIRHIASVQNLITIEVVPQKRTEASGELYLEFTENPMSLRGWTAVGEDGAPVKILLSIIQAGKRFDPKLFQIPN